MECANTRSGDRSGRCINTLSDIEFSIKADVTAFIPNGRFVRVAVIDVTKMMRLARMSDLGKR